MNLESLRHMLDSYLATREAIGLKDRRHRKLLEDFLQHVAKEKPAGPIPAQMVVDWACSTPRPDAAASPKTSEHGAQAGAARSRYF